MYTLRLIKLQRMSKMVLGRCQKGQKWRLLRIELRTSCTLSINHTTRPQALAVEAKVGYLILVNTIVSNPDKRKVSTIKSEFKNILVQ